MSVIQEETRRLQMFTENPKDLENYYELLLVIYIAWLARKSLFALSICQEFLEGTTIHDDELDGISSKKHNCNW